MDFYLPQMPDAVELMCYGIAGLSCVMGLYLIAINGGILNGKKLNTWTKGDLKEISRDLFVGRSSFRRTRKGLELK